MNGVFVVVASIAAAVSGLRWLRVAQREHYLPWSVSVFAKRWWLIDRRNTILIAVAATAGALALLDIAPVQLGFLVAAIVVAAPIGLSLKGSSSPVAWTPRLRRVAFTAATIWVLMGALALVVESVGLLAYELVAVPLIVDLALSIMWPVEMRSQQTWVDQAKVRLDAVEPVVVAITGSYGKTSTKEYVRALIARQGATVASPASFNNKMGLARAINEHLSDGTEFFIAEMGTYGPGEIAELCRIVEPQVAVMTAIGPVHLERFGTIDNVVTAKAEITERAQAVVLNIDDDRLAALVPSLVNKRVVTVSAGGSLEADVILAEVDEGVAVSIDGVEVAVVAAVPLLTNLACAIGVLVALDLPTDALGERLASVTLPDHRQSVYVSESGITIIDDTYNSNPAGTRAALAKLQGLGTGRRAVVTPGMVELGPRQYEENMAFAEAAGGVADHLVVVARSNRAALLEGAAKTDVPVIVVGSRDEAVAWVRQNLQAGDAVLYENDLPDHHP